MVSFSYGGQAAIDWRRDYSCLTYQIHQLPTSIEQACVRLVEVFNLQFSAIDLIVTPEGEYVFLEQNGNGQWLWLERETGQPMTEALIDLLESANGLGEEGESFA